jgi:aspartate/methionine/tyrosine aminotransferase
VNIISAETPTLSESMTVSVIGALETAFAAAEDPTKIKALIMSNPDSPFFKCWNPDLLRACLDFWHSHNLHYISDEVFANTVFDESDTQFISALSLIDHGENMMIQGEAIQKSKIAPSFVHVIWSASKDFGCSGVRLVCSNLLYPVGIIN